MSVVRGFPQRLEVPLVLALVLVTQSEVWWGWSDGGAGVVPTGDRPVRAVLVLLTLLPLLTARRRPLASLLVVCAGIWVQVTWVTPSVSFLGAFLPLAVASYATAVRAARARWLGLVAGFATLGVLAARIPEERQESEVLFGALVLTSIWLAGDVVRARLSRADRTEAAAARALVDERDRMARELHDVIAHGVSVMGVQAGAARRLMDSGDGVRARTAVLAIEETARSAVEELQRLLTLLHDPDIETDDALQPRPGLARLPELVDGVRAAGLPVQLTGEPARPLPPGADLAAYRVVQEALTNALKHSGGPTTVRLAAGPDGVRVEVVNDPGTPSRSPGAGVGHGLIGMRERVALYGGSLSAGPTPDGGFRVVAELPA